VELLADPVQEAARSKTISQRLVGKRYVEGGSVCLTHQPKRAFDERIFAR